MTIRTIRRIDLALRRRENLGDLLDRLASVHGDRRMVTEHASGRVLTFRDAAALVSDWSERVASVVAPGEPVVVATPNGYDQLLLSLAVSRAGGLPAPLNHQMSDLEVRHVVADSGAALVLRSSSDLPATRGTAPLDAVDQGDPAALFYTSGTTGAPKGAVLSHRSIVGQTARAALFPSPLRHDEVVAGLPVSHIMGFVIYLGLAVAGVPVYCFERFRAAEVLDVIETRRPSAFVGVPAMYRMLEESGAAGRDLSSVRVWMSGADVMPPDLVKEFKHHGATVRIPGLGSVGEATFVEGYGMVEVGGGIAVKLSPPYIPLGAGDSLGFRLPGYKFRVVGDDDGSEVTVGDVGELWVKGPGVLTGYWNDPDATAEALSDDGWLRTGDLVRSGPLGTVVFAGRRKQVIKSGGFSVYPPEIETVVEQHPAVAEAAVVGIPDSTLGEVPAVVARLVPGATVTEDELIAWAGVRLAHYKAPRRAVFVDDLPRTVTQKISRNGLSELFPG